MSKNESKGRSLSTPKMVLFGLQHMFAMFGATILVPILTGLSVQVTLLGVGVGTLLFHLITKGKVPAFLGSSFAFLVGIQLVIDPTAGIFPVERVGDYVYILGNMRGLVEGTAIPLAEFTRHTLPYATGAILVSGLVYVLFSLIIKLVGVKRFMKALPPIVTAPTVILIGIMLAPFAINQSSENILLAVATLAIVVIASAWGKGMVKIIPILLGIGGAYLLAVFLHNFTGFTNANGSAIIDLAGAARRVGRLGYVPGADTGYYMEHISFLGLPPFMLPRFNIIAILIMIPFAIATIAEHIGDMVALSNITGEDFLEDPGLGRTLLGDGVASMFSGFIGGAANTTYGENVGVVALTRIFNPRVVQIGAVFAAILAFSPLFAVVIYSIPTAIIGGASFMLYGMIAAVGIRNLVDSRVDISKTKNLTIIAIMLVIGLGLRFANPITFAIGDTNIPLSRLGIAIAVVVGVILNAILPDKAPTEAVK
ncbi:MAG: uracil-xanthine permease [Defluviitaleaceae bacterium]|nr:uracil-xanthine permease [Defluviitaleaceae bacterium]